MPSDPVFTPEQEKVLALLSAGHTATAAAAAAGVHRNTVGNWLRSSSFRQTLAHIQYQKALLWREKAEALAPAAFETIRQVMADPRAPAGVRLKAANTIIAAATAPLPMHPDDVQITGSVHKNAQPAGVLPELPPAPEPQPEPLPKVHNGAQSAPASSLPPITYESVAAKARATLAQLRPDLLKEIDARAAESPATRRQPLATAAEGCLKSKFAGFPRDGGDSYPGRGCEAPGMPPGAGKADDARF
jgi:DNA-binding CsgD family transcriptional regulator